jgi:hypothetical protein
LYALAYWDWKVAVKAFRVVEDGTESMSARTREREYISVL